MVLKVRNAGSEQDNDGWVLSDAELGVGEETPADAAAHQKTQMDAVLADPTIAALVEQLVQKRIAELAASPVAPAAPSPGVNVELAAAIKMIGRELADALSRNTNATIEQMPGHVKPIPPEEVEKRGAAWVELQSLLADTVRRFWLATQKGRQSEADQHSPLYLLDEEFFGPGKVGSEMFVRGQTIRWYGVPGTFMEPRNDIAKRLSELAWTYLGNEGAPSAEDLENRTAGMIPDTPGAALPEIALLMSARSRGRPEVSIVPEAGVADLSSANIVGSVVIARGGIGRGQTQPRTGPHQFRGPAPAEPLV